MIREPSWCQTSADQKQHTVTITLILPREQAASLARFLKTASDTHAASEREGMKIRRIAQWIIKAVQSSGQTRYIYNGRVTRPSSRYRSESDMQHVLHGRAPFPILSLRDLSTVYPLLEARGMSAREIADRLHVRPRTVQRWRSEERRRKET